MKWIMAEIAICVESEKDDLCEIMDKITIDAKADDGSVTIKECTTENFYEIYT